MKIFCLNICPMCIALVGSICTPHTGCLLGLMFCKGKEMRLSDLVPLKHTCSISLSEEKGSITPHRANIPCQASLEEKLNKDISGVSPGMWKVFVRVPLKKSLVLVEIPLFSCSAINLSFWPFSSTQLEGLSVMCKDETEKPLWTGKHLEATISQNDMPEFRKAVAMRDFWPRIKAFVGRLRKKPSHFAMDVLEFACYPVPTCS